MTETDVADVLRVAAFVIASLSLVMAGTVVVHYFRAYRRFTRYRQARWKGLLPRHVVLVAISYFGLTAITVLRTMGRIHSGFTWWQPPLVILYALGAWAMRDVLVYQRHRTVRVLPDEAVIESDREVPEDR